LPTIVPTRITTAPLYTAKLLKPPKRQRQPALQLFDALAFLGYFTIKKERPIS